MIIRRELNTENFKIGDLVATKDMLTDDYVHFRRPQGTITEVKEDCVLVRFRTDRSHPFSPDSLILLERSPRKDES